MKSGKQRRLEIKQKRIEQAKKLQAQLMEPGSKAKPYTPGSRSPVGLPADPDKLLHDNTYGPRPEFYYDLPFTCIDCGSEELWTAKQKRSR